MKIAEASLLTLLWVAISSAVSLIDNYHSRCCAANVIIQYKATNGEGGFVEAGFVGTGSSDSEALTSAGDGLAAISNLEPIPQLISRLGVSPGFAVTKPGLTLKRLI